MKKTKQLSDMQSKYVIVGIDPGITTGWAAIGWDSDTIPPINGISEISQGQYSTGNSGNKNSDTFYESETSMCLQLGWELHQLITNSNNTTILAIEDFISRRLDYSRDYLSPVRISAGLIQQLVFSTAGSNQPLNYSFRSAADAKRVCTDERLEQWGFPTPTRADRHSRDALRHAVLKFRELKTNPKMHKALFSPPTN